MSNRQPDNEPHVRTETVARFTARAGARPKVVMTLTRGKVSLRIGGIVRVTMDHSETEFMAAALRQMADGMESSR